jgi:hypothetical protein
MQNQSMCLNVGERIIEAEDTKNLDALYFDKFMKSNHPVSSKNSEFSKSMKKPCQYKSTKTTAVISNDSNRTFRRHASTVELESPKGSLFTKKVANSEKKVAENSNTSGKKSVYSNNVNKRSRIPQPKTKGLKQPSKIIRMQKPDLPPSVNAQSDNF